MKVVICSERQSDIQAIFELTRAAFEKLPISNHTEQFIVNALRDAKALTISLVAKGCVLVGDPVYNERFGFRSLTNLVIEDVPQEYVLALPFRITGRVVL
jgi:predicted N-acetyltransferase YhbS